MGDDRHRCANVGGDDAGLSGSDNGVNAALDSPLCRGRPADLRRVLDRSRPGAELRRRYRPVTCRSVQALATGPARPNRQAVQRVVVPAADVAAEDVLHSHHRMGMERRPSPRPDLLRGRPKARRVTPEIPRRRRLRDVHASPRRGTGRVPTAGC